MYRGQDQWAKTSNADLAKAIRRQYKYPPSSDLMEACRRLEAHPTYRPSQVTLGSTPRLAKGEPV